METLYEGRWLRLCRRDHWEYVERSNVSGTVAILAITPESKIILTRQFRIPVQKLVIELPAGLVGDVAGQELEAFETAALRELEEETGYAAEKLTALAEGTSSAGLSTEMSTIFLAEGLSKIGAGGGVGHEQIETLEIPLQEVESWLQERLALGELVDFKLYAALHLAASIRNPVPR